MVVVEKPPDEADPGGSGMEVVVKPPDEADPGGSGMEVVVKPLWVFEKSTGLPEPPR